MSGKSPNNMHVAVLAGGYSTERDVSLRSGKNVVHALVQAGYTTVDLLDPAADGFILRLLEGAYDAAFIAMHGEGGEDGKIQGLLEWMGIPYTGSDVTASACGMDKEVSKLMYARSGIPVALDAVVMRGVPYDSQEIVRKLGSKLFVKPAVNGSSFGVTLVKGVDELAPAIEKAFASGDNAKVLVEQCLEGTEITVGVYGDNDLEALPIVEICKPETSEFYDESVKYIDPSLVHRIPAQISDKDAAEARRLAKAAHKALGCFGFSRTDFIVTENGPVILETNTIPGMTDASLYPDEVKHAGKAFAEVCDGLIKMALIRAGAQC